MAERSETWMSYQVEQESFREDDFGENAQRVFQKENAVTE
jgi:hypothetical protein